MHKHFAARGGYSLVEMMIVVAIMGVLASIAIPAFRSYIYLSKTSEATTFIGEIRQRQESYRAEFGQYCAVSGSTWGTWTPTTLPTGTAVAWPGGTNWTQLGASPDTGVYFQYASIAGAPGTTPPGGLGYDGSDFWFVTEARADLDQDGTIVTFEGYSSASSIWCSQQKGWE